MMDTHWSGAAGAEGPSTSLTADACFFDQFDRRWPSAHRRHGDPFPLPRLSRPTVTSMPTRQVDAAFRSLNTLAMADFQRTASSGLPLTAVQSWMMDDLYRRVLSYGSRPEDLNEDEALRDLTSQANLYNQEANNIAVFNIDEIKILQRKLTPYAASDLAPLEARSYLDNFDVLVERPGHELEELRQRGELVKPHWDEQLRDSRHLRLQLYQRLSACGLLTFRRRQKAKVGMFTVKKKGDKPGNTQRLLVDCRQANYLQHKPPTTRLATPSGLTSLDMTKETLEHVGFSKDIFHDHPIQPSLETGDVGDCFYNFSIEKACSWFSTGDIIDTAEMRRLGIYQDTIFDDEMGCGTGVVEGESLYICFGGMPMGWSWALYFAQEIICEQCLKACGAPASDLIRDKNPPPTIRPQAAALGVYVDNVHSFGGNSNDATQRMERIQQHFNKLGIPFDVDGVSGNSCVDTLRLTFCFSDEKVRVRAKSGRAWRLWAATRAILRRRRISGDLLRVWIGHVNFHFLLSRPLLSSLSSCYAFVAAHAGHRFPMWDSVRKELKLVLGLIFVVEKDLTSSINPCVHVGDSSDRGYGLMSMHADRETIRRELQHHEKWRFLVSREISPTVLQNGGPQEQNSDDPQDDDVFLGSTPCAGVGTSTHYGVQLAEDLDKRENTTNFKQQKKRLFGPSTTTGSTMIQVHSIPEVSSQWADPTRWDLITSGPWKRVDEHINIKEARVALMSLRRMCRSVANMNSTCFTLCDNMCAVMMFEKGRSGVAGLNGLCRRAAAYQVGANVVWRLRHIKSEDNVADKPSRNWGSDLPRGLACRNAVSLNALGEHVTTDSFEQGQEKSASSRAPRKVRSTGFSSSMVELFAGTGCLSDAMRKAGLRTLPPFEVANGRQYNLLNKDIQNLILGLIRGGHVWLVHLGTPCTVWSRARHGIRNIFKSRLKEQYGVACALFTCRVIKECLKRGVIFTLENPTSSRLWQFKPIEDLFRYRQICFITFDLCCFGKPYKKSTSIMTNEKSFSMLGQRCRGGRL